MPHRNFMAIMDYICLYLMIDLTKLPTNVVSFDLTTIRRPLAVGCLAVNWQKYDLGCHAPNLAQT